MRCSGSVQWMRGHRFSFQSSQVSTRAEGQFAAPRPLAGRPARGPQQPSGSCSQRNKRQ